MYELRRIGERSVGRLYGIAGLIVGVIAGVLFTPFLFLAFRHTLHAGWIAIPVFFAIVLIVGIVCALDGLIASFLYNILASYIGGVKMEIKRKTLVYVDPQSYAKINTALAIIFMVIAGLIILIFAGPLLLLASRAGPNVTSMFSFAGPYLVLIVVLGFIALALFTYVLSYLAGLFYNWLVQKMGGVKIEIAKGVLEHIDLESFAKIAAVLTVLQSIVSAIMIGFVMLVLYLAGGQAQGLALAYVGTSILVYIASELFSLIVTLVLAFLFAAIEGWLYNWLASKVGGFEINLKKTGK